MKDDPNDQPEIDATQHQPDHIDDILNAKLDEDLYPGFLEGVLLNDEYSNDEDHHLAYGPGVLVTCTLGDLRQRYADRAIGEEDATLAQIEAERIALELSDPAAIQTFDPTNPHPTSSTELSLQPIALDVFDDRVVVRPLPRVVGLIHEDAGDELEVPLEGIVVGIGPGRLDYYGKRLPMPLELFDLVLYPKYGGVDIAIDKEPLKVFRADEIYARRPAAHNPYKEKATALLQDLGASNLVLAPDGADVESAVADLKLK